MTRKRFVKLIMSHGVSRNRAQDLAKYTRSKGPYKEGYETWKMVNNLSDPFSSISEAILKVGEEVSRLASSICAAVNSFSSVITVSMQDPSPLGGKCPRCGGTGVELQMQALAQVGGSSVRGPDMLKVCPRCFGTGKELI